MAHGRNNPTGNIGFSPIMITLFAPFAFVAKAWQAAICGFFGMIAILIVVAWLSHEREVAADSRARREREAREC